MTPIIDTHCHLADPKFESDLDGVLARAREAAIAQIVTVGAIGPLARDRLSVQIAEQHEWIFAAVGVHPHNAPDCDDQRIDALRGLAKSAKVVAIGETGLDFHYLHSPADTQEMALRKHLELAGELDKPIIIHCRDADERLAAIVRETEMPRAGGVIHCFTGGVDAAESFLALGFYLSFSGILTFKNASEPQKAAQIIPEDRLMVETDAPYLAPVPYRGKRNEPAFVRQTLGALAKLRDADSERLGAVAACNARRLFRLPEACG